MLKRVVFIVAISGSLAFAQLDSNSITVTATQSSSVQPDQAIVDLSVTSGITSALTDVVSALQPLGITAANFSGLNGAFGLNAQQGPQLQWTFQTQVPLTQLKATLASISSLEQTIGQNNSGLQLSFSVAGTAFSQQALAAQSCSLPGLIASARAQAQQLAAAAGLSSGPILALASSGVTPINLDVATGFSSLIGSLPSPCSVTVKFALGTL